MTPPSESPRDPRLVPKPRFRPDIEGLRAFAVLVVVAYHAHVPGFAGGFVGVDVFFVLSGYLITWLLLDERQRTGGIDLPRFYARRFRRLLPAMAVMLVVTGLVTAWLYAPYEQRALIRTWVATALYVSNLHFAEQAAAYHALDTAANPLLHTWSLAVEEQFYFVWPLLIAGATGLWLGARTASRRRVALWLGLTGLASFAYALWSSSATPLWAFYGSPARAWEFAAGGLAALVQVRQPGRLWQAGAWVGLAGLVAATVGFTGETVWPGWPALLPVVGTLLVLKAGEGEAQGSALGAVLGSRPAVWLGGLSYSWYLWHWPALVFAAAALGPLPLAGRVLVGAASLLPAWLSYRYVETPVRLSRALVTPPRRAFGMAAAVAVLVVGASAAWWTGARAWEASPVQAAITQDIRQMDRLYRDGCDTFRRTTTPQPCVYGDSAADYTVVLLGDSHAAQWAPAVREAAEARGARLVTLVMSACPAVDTPVFAVALGRRYTECEEWRGHALAMIAEMAPDLVITASASNAYAEPDDWEAGTYRMLRALEGVSGRTALVLDNPNAGFDGGACAARAAWRGGGRPCVVQGREGNHALVQAQRRAAERAGAEVIDLRDRVAVVGETDLRDGPLRYRDADHLTVDFARTFSEDFAALLL